MRSAMLPGATSGARGTSRSTPSTRSARRGAVLLGLTFALAATIVMSLLVGARAVSPTDVWSALGGSSGSTDDVVIRTLRLPRTVLGVLVGAALSMAGALIQALTRNPLADPGLIGVNAGASLAVVVSLTFLGWSGVLATTGAAIAGAAGALVLVLALSSRRQMSPLTVVLAGTAATAAIGGVTSGLLIADSRAMDQVRFWSIGSLAGRDPDLLWPSVAVLAVAAVLAAALAIPLSTLALGEEMATSLGTSVGATRWAVLGVVALLAGTATAVAGPIGFVGLAVPALARRLATGDVRWTLAYSAALGALLLLAADIVGRVVVWPGELEVGIVAAVAGAPLLIIIARQSRIERA